MNKGDTIYYHSKESQHIYSTKFLGETSRSWLVGVEWSPSKLPKKTTVFVTKEEYDSYLWAERNRYRIGDCVRYGSHEQLRKIADLIGYVEEAKK